MSTFLYIFDLILNKYFYLYILLLQHGNIAVKPHGQHFHQNIKYYKQTKYNTDINTSPVSPCDVLVKLTVKTSEMK